MSNLVSINTIAPTAKMVPAAAVLFNQLRPIVLEGSGVDFLAKCGDVLRPADFHSSKDGVADRSWHKTGRAFDYDQENRALVLESDPSGGRQYFRTYLRCADQSGKLGQRRSVRDYRGGLVSAFLFDFTEAAERIGFKRIPAWTGWQTHYNRKEFWHYQHDEGLTWAAAMAQVNAPADPAAAKSPSLQPVPSAVLPVSAPNSSRVYGRNDRDSNTGGMISKIQRSLYLLHLLPSSEVDGIFGAMTFEAVRMFQRLNKLTPDGLAGPKTLHALGY